MTDSRPNEPSLLCPLLATNPDCLRPSPGGRYERPYLARRGAVAALALAECAEHRGRFVDSLVWGTELERAILRLVNPPRRGCLRVLIE
jgi:hypothetical protein